MNSKLFAALEQKIDEWVEQSCEDANWPDMFTGQKLAHYMAVAAGAVVDACEEAQVHARHEGYMTTGG